MRTKPIHGLCVMCDFYHLILHSRRINYFSAWFMFALLAVSEINPLKQNEIKRTRKHFLWSHVKYVYYIGESCLTLRVNHGIFRCEITGPIVAS